MKTNLHIPLLIITLFLLLHCNKNNNFPKIQINSNPGDFVLAPPSNFVNNLNSDSNKFIAFYPRRMIKPGKKFSQIQEFDSTVLIPNILIIPLKSQSMPHKGEFVLTWWQKGTGMQRAFIINTFPSDSSLVQYLDLDSTLLLDSSSSIQKISKTSFAIIDKPLKPGSSLAYDTSGVFQFFIVVKNINQNKLLAINWSGKLQYLNKNKIFPNPVKPKLNPGDSAAIPVFGIYTPAKIIKISNGLVIAQYKFAGLNKTTIVPELDVNTKILKKIQR